MKRTIAPPVSLSNWAIIPSIDFISILVPADEIERAALLPGYITKRVIVPRVPRDIVLTLHDPKALELQALINAWPKAEIREIEFTVDFEHRDNVRASKHNEDLFRWFSDCLVPAFPDARQRYFKGPVVEQGKYRRLGGTYSFMPKNGTTSTTTRIWRNRSQYNKNRLYIKCDDTRKRIPQWVRLEATFNRGGCQEQGVQHLWQLVPFAAKSRRNLSPFFNIASGIKPRLRRVDRFTKGTARHLAAVKANKVAVAKATRGWARRGAMWAAEHGLKTTPHREANARIGKALDRLRIELSTLKLPNFSPDVTPDYEQKPVKNQCLEGRSDSSL